MRVAGGRTGDGVLVAAYDTCLLDLDGVVYVGPRAVAGVTEALDRVRRGGVRVLFVTNNASRTPAAIAAHLDRLGVPAEARDVATSAQAAASLLAGRCRRGAPVLVVGGIGLRQAVREWGFQPVSTAGNAPVAVAQGYAPDLSVALLAEGALAVGRGAFYVASNADATLPTARGPVPGNGALSEVIRSATGRTPIFAGKPDPALYREAIERAGGRRALVVGDRLETDIEGAVRAGLDSLLVFSGVASPLDAVLAPPERRPTYLARDLRALAEPYPEVRRGEGVWFCGGWKARRHRDGIEVVGAGDPMDGLRALCAAVWESADRVPLAAVRDAVARLAERLRADSDG